MEIAQNIAAYICLSLAYNEYFYMTMQKRAISAPVFNGLSQIVEIHFGQND
jgi:hypothetical protein